MCIVNTYINKYKIAFNYIIFHNKKLKKEAVYKPKTIL